MPKGMTKRRPETRARLFDAALEVFAEQGFSGASIEDICRRAGYTRGAFYSNFATRDELFFALFDARARRAMEWVVTASDDGSGEPITLEQIAELVAHVPPDERNWYLVTTEFTLYAIRNPEAARTLAEHDDEVRGQVARGLGDLLARAGLSCTIDLDELARMIITLREGALGQSFVDPGGQPPAWLVRRFLELLLPVVVKRRPRRGNGPASRPHCPI
ncbi:MAG: TetR/AcrR family transcriptional regulator [Kutzneria sp.]|nr:TetR/AcrR family transcriptional regulator [Kutzneria sp.]MBV9845089.1 TetR/AcrR family transcriptional regulator [Kutzneria sp.]